MTSTRIHFGTGINRSHDRTVGKMAERLHTHYCANVHDLRYSPVNWWTAGKPEHVTRVADLILQHVKPGDHFVAHSWHANPLQEALSRGAVLGKVILFAPACDRAAIFAGRYQSLTVVHNHYDIAVMVGQVLPCHIFGSAGRVGLDQAEYDDRVSNYDAESIHGPFNHSFYFQDDLHEWTSRVAWWLR